MRMMSRALARRFFAGADIEPRFVLPEALEELDALLFHAAEKASRLAGVACSQEMLKTVYPRHVKWAWEVVKRRSLGLPE